MKKILFIFLTFLFSASILIAEIPHSYVYENPNRAVTTTNMIKRHKEKAELTLIS